MPCLVNTNSMPSSHGAVYGLSRKLFVSKFSLKSAKSVAENPHFYGIYHPCDVSSVGNLQLSVERLQLWTSCPLKRFNPRCHCHVMPRKTFYCSSEFTVTTDHLAGKTRKCGGIFLAVLGKVGELTKSHGNV